MPPQTRSRAHLAGGQAAASLPLPPLPDELWEHILGCFTENRDYFGFALVCKRFRDLVRHGRLLDLTAFEWSEQPGCASTLRAELFADWLATRVGRPCSSLLLRMLPTVPYLADISSSLRQSLWCTLGQLAPQLTSLELRASNSLIPQVGGWVSGFTRLECLLLCSYDCGLKVSASLASLTRLSSLTLMARTREHALIQTAEDAIFAAEARGVHLTLPESSFLPTSLRLLRLSSPTLATLPACLSALTGLSALLLESRRQMPADLLCGRLLPLALELHVLSMAGGMAPPLFLSHLTAFTKLEVLDLSRSPQGELEYEEYFAVLQAGLALLAGLVSLTLNGMELQSLPPAVTAMRGLQHLDVSMNLPSLTLPAGPYLHAVQSLAADWGTLRNSPQGALASLQSLEELCIMLLPQTGARVAAVLRSLAALPCLQAVYMDIAQFSAHRSVKAALKQLRRTKPALQLLELTGCPF